MSSFGGSLNSGLAPYPKLNINSAPLDLSAFAFTTFVLSLYNTQVLDIIVPNVVVGNTFGPTRLTSYGAFWISFTPIHIKSFGISGAYNDEVMLANAIGFYLLGWSLFTFLLVLTTMKSTVVFFSLFFALFITFILLTVGELTAKPGYSRAGGIFEVVTACLGWYNTFAGVATKQNSYFTTLSISSTPNMTEDLMTLFHVPFFYI